MAVKNPYKFFRGVKTPTATAASQLMTAISGEQLLINNLLSKTYDEPTYMTFRVMFGQSSAIWSGTSLLNTNYDRMPHPLFVNQQVDATSKQGEGGKTVLEFNRNFYSTIDYLRDSNEFTRAEMLKEFINIWQDLQKNFQWYFQSIEGVADLLKIVPERGKRVGKDVMLTFNMLEGIDQRISYLLNLYKKIAWDDVYQRWVLPDMMRFFDIQIYITEFRTFHQSGVTLNSDEPVFLQILNGILPTYLVECEMCEFDLNSFDYSYRNKLSVADSPEMTTVNFKVKVGNVNEISIYPLFTHFIMDDKKLNGIDRSKEKGIMKDKDGRVLNAVGGFSGGAVGIGMVPFLNFQELEYVSTKNGDMRYRDLDKVAQDTFFQKEHVSGAPFIDQGYGNLRNSTPNYSTDVNSVDPTKPETWVGNAITFGKSFATNLANTVIDKAKMTEIPGLGVSFNEAASAIESKDFTSVLALIRKSITRYMENTLPPSSQLEKKIDTTFKEFLVGITQSEATDQDSLEIVKTANQILSDRGKWETVRDLSYATNMTSQNEKNIPVTIESGNQYKQYVTTSTQNNKSKATEDPNIIKTGIIYEGLPSSEATNSPKIE
jgi:hypothetical protein